MAMTVTQMMMVMTMTNILTFSILQAAAGDDHLDNAVDHKEDIDADDHDKDDDGDDNDNDSNDKDDTAALFRDQKEFLPQPSVESLDIELDDLEVTFIIITIVIIIFIIITIMMPTIKNAYFNVKEQAGYMTKEKN